MPIESGVQYADNWAVETPLVNSTEYTYTVTPSSAWCAATGENNIGTTGATVTKNVAVSNNTLKIIAYAIEDPTDPTLSMCTFNVTLFNA